MIQELLGAVKKTIHDEIKQKQSSKNINNNIYVKMTMETDKVVVLELYPQIAPITVGNFVNLVNKGFYNGLIFHRVIKGFMIQGGCPNGTGTGGAEITIQGEFSSNGFNNKLKHTKGVISMARNSQFNSASSQFFIMLDNAPHLDGQYAAFGKVISGMDVIDEIGNTKTDYTDKPLVNQQIKAMEVIQYKIAEVKREQPQNNTNQHQMNIRNQVNKQPEPAQNDYSVFNYIKRMSTKELLNAIASEYAHIKGTLNNAPAMGEYGSVEFAGALLIWKYCKEHLYGNKSKICGSLMINLGETIGCAYFNMPAGEWSNKIDMVINTNELLDYTEWNYIYNYLKENYIIYIHKFEFCNGICPETDKQAIYSAFVQRYNELDTLSEVFMFYQSMGLNLKSDMPFTING